MEQSAAKLDFNGLKTKVPGLAARDYFDPGQHELELRKIWYRNWIYVGRSQDVEKPRSFQTFEVGDQRVLLVRDERGTLRGFYNTCRHRGSLLCDAPAGELRSAAIVCPYHAWVYDLQGRLLRTTSKSTAAGFDVQDLPLYPITVKEWQGFVFIALCAQPPDFARLFDTPLNRMDAWPLHSLRVGHVFTKIMQCNWKIFWENYNECLHCPGVHPQLSRLVPIFGRALMEERDDPQWPHHADDADPKFKGGLRQGASTWSKDGAPIGPVFDTLSAADRQAAHVYMTALPSMFIVGHPDYVRVVRLRPLGPEQTELRVEYLFSTETLENPHYDWRNAVEFSNVVMGEDAQVCELNQRGLHAAPHEHGVLMPEEYVVLQFHDWLRAELARA
jgi:Rieske 2Fe-2S family protein